MSSKMKERLHTGEIYLPGDDEILEEQFQCQEKLYDYNQTRPSEGEKRSKLLKEMFAEIGDGCLLSHLFVLTGAVTSYISEKIFMLTLI